MLQPSERFFLLIFTYRMTSEDFVYSTQITWTMLVGFFCGGKSGNML